MSKERAYTKRGQLVGSGLLQEHFVSCVGYSAPHAAVPLGMSDSMRLAGAQGLGGDDAW
jgi:hypothetical protein